MNRVAKIACSYMDHSIEYMLTNPYLKLSSGMVTGGVCGHVLFTKPNRHPYECALIGGMVTTTGPFLPFVFGSTVSIMGFFYGLDIIGKKLNKKSQSLDWPTSN